MSLDFIRTKRWSLFVAYYVALVSVIVAFIVTVSLAVVTSFIFTLESSTQEFAVAVAPINIPASVMVLDQTSGLQKNLSK